MLQWHILHQNVWFETVIKPVSVTDDARMDDLTFNLTLV